MIWHNDQSRLQCYLVRDNFRYSISTLLVDKKRDCNSRFAITDVVCENAPAEDGDDLAPDAFDALVRDLCIHTSARLPVVAPERHSPPSSAFTIGATSLTTCRKHVVAVFHSGWSSFPNLNGAGHSYLSLIGIEYA